MLFKFKEYSGVVSFALLIKSALSISHRKGILKKHLNASFFMKIRM